MLLKQVVLLAYYIMLYYNLGRGQKCWSTMMRTEVSSRHESVSQNVFSCCCFKHKNSELKDTQKRKKNSCYYKQKPSGLIIHRLHLHHRQHPDSYSLNHSEVCHQPPPPPHPHHPTLTPLLSFFHTSYQCWTLTPLSYSQDGSKPHQEDRKLVCTGKTGASWSSDNTGD